MKKTYTLLFALGLLSASLNAQITISTAPDFTIKDLNGNSFNLYSTLAQGKYVAIDFFFTTCQPCQATAPKFKGAYQNYGCNTGNVVFISIDNGDTDPQCKAYESSYVGANGPPMFSGVTGGGDAAVSSFMPQAFPTLILIAPNKQIVEKDMWPIANAAAFDPFLSSHGLNYSACATGVGEVASPFNFEMFPNPASNVLNISSKNHSEISSVKIIDFTGKAVVSEIFGAGNESVSLQIAALPKGVYFAEIMTSAGRLVEKFAKQ